MPDDRTIVVERFRDELGDWRVCVHSPFGARINAPWSLAIEAAVRDRLGLDVQCMYTDDGIVARLPEADDAPPASSILFDPDSVEDLVVGQVGNSALFASRFRECAARALLLPRRNPGTRTPLWQQRQKSAQLLQVASKHETFPVVLEAYRECLQDVFDLPGLIEIMSAVARREVKVVEVETALPSPFASSLQFGYVTAFMYEGDAPLAERRAQALSLDRSLLAEIMGREELRELIDESALADIELELQWLTSDRKARSADALHDALRALGDLTSAEIAARAADPPRAGGWLDELVASHRAIEVRVSGETRAIAIEDAGRYRDALGVALPVGIPGAFTESVPDPLGDLIGRYAATHGPFDPSDPGARLGLGPAVCRQALERLEVAGRVVEGEFRPGGTAREWIDVEVLRRLRRRSLAAFRKEVEPAPPEALARFSLAWHGIGSGSSRAASPDELFRVIEQLQGVPIPASALERQVLPARLPGYTPGLLDALGASGEIVWGGAGPLGADDGWIVLAPADRASLVLPEPVDSELSETALAVKGALDASGASFFRQLAERVGSTDDNELLGALWDLVWAGWVTNDTLAPVRAVSGGRRSARPAPEEQRPPVPLSAGTTFGGRPVEPARTEGDRPHAQAGRNGRAVARAPRHRDERLAPHRAPTWWVRRRLSGTEGDGGGRSRSPRVFRRRARRRSVRAVRRRRPHALPRARGARRSGDGRARRNGPRQSVRGGPAVARARGTPAGRKAGAAVVLTGGELILYVEKGGRTILSFADDPERLQPAVDALALAAHDGVLGRLAVERADGESVLDSPFASVLMDAGFKLSSRGLRLRA